MNERPTIALQYCPGCDTYAPSVAAGADVDRGLGAPTPMFSTLPLPPLCSSCWAALLAVVKLRDREYLKVKLTELDARIARNLAKQQGGKETEP